MKRLGFLLPFIFSKAFVTFISAPRKQFYNQKCYGTHSCSTLDIKGQWRDTKEENILKLIQCHDIGNSD